MTLKFIKNVESLKNWTICVPSFKIFFDSIVLDWNWSTKMLLFLSSSFPIESTKPWVPTLYHTHHFPKIPAQWFSMILQCWIKIDTPRGWFYAVAWHLDMLIHLGLSPKGLEFFPHLLTDFSDTGFSVEVLQATQHRFFRNRFFRNKFFRYKFFTIQSAKKQIQNPKSRSKIKMLKNCKHCEQNIKVEITKKKLQSLAHKRVWQKFGGKSQKALEKDFARVLFASTRPKRGCTYHK